MNIVRVFRAVAGAAEMHTRLYLFSQIRILNGVVLPVVMTSLAIFLLKSSSQAGSANFRLLVGGGLVGMWSGLLGTAAFTIRREAEWFGTVPLLAVTPTPLSVIFTGYLLAEGVLAFFGVAVSLLTGWLMLGMLQFPLTPALLVSLAFATLAMVSLGALTAPIMVLLPVLTRWVNVFEYPIWILAGFMFPIAILPRWTNPASYVLPPFWGAEALERATASGGLPAIVPIWIVTIALSAGYLAAALMVFRLVTRRMALTGALTAG